MTSLLFNLRKWQSQGSLSKDVFERRMLTGTGLLHSWELWLRRGVIPKGRRPHFRLMCVAQRYHTQGSHSLEKSLNFLLLWICSGLESIFLMLFGCPRQDMNHSSENLKVIYTNCSMFYAIINYQFNTSELKNEEKMVKQTVQALKLY